MIADDPSREKATTKIHPGKAAENQLVHSIHVFHQAIRWATLPHCVNHHVGRPAVHFP
jgi:hypothetical protein